MQRAAPPRSASAPPRGPSRAPVLAAPPPGPPPPKAGGAPPASGASPTGGSAAPRRAPLPLQPKHGPGRRRASLPRPQGASSPSTPPEERELPVGPAFDDGLDEETRQRLASFRGALTRGLLGLGQSPLARALQAQEAARAVQLGREPGWVTRERSRSRDGPAARAAPARSRERSASARRRRRGRSLSSPRAAGGEGRTVEGDRPSPVGRTGGPARRVDWQSISYSGRGKRC